MKISYSLNGKDYSLLKEVTLNKASGFIRKELCSRIEIRKMPEITFVYDNSIEYGNKIEHILEEIKKEDSGSSNGED